MGGAFAIKRHAVHAILEIVYPESPGPLDLAQYLIDARGAIEAMPPRWACLVDQLALRHGPADALRSKIAAMNAYALQRGMLRCARIVPQGREAQAAELAAVPDGYVRVFTARSPAERWLVEELSR